MSDLLPISHEPVDYLNLVPEARIRNHAILRLRAGQPVPDYHVGDEAFDAIVRRTNASIDRDATGPYLTLAWGTTRARIYAAGVMMESHDINLVEQNSSERERQFGMPAGLETGSALVERTRKPMSVEETTKLDEVRMKLLCYAERALGAHPDGAVSASWALTEYCSLLAATK